MYEGWGARGNRGGDSIGAEHRGEAEHGAAQACRGQLVGPVDGQGPGGGRGGGLVVGQPQAVGQYVGKGAGAVGEQPVVRGTVEAGVDEVGGCLRERERQVAEVGDEESKSVGRLVTVVGGQCSGQIGACLLGELERRLLDVRAACPDIARARDLARAFAELLRHRRGFLLTQWIRQAEQDAPKSVSGFAGFPCQNLDAVTAGLTLHWSSGLVEGHVNRVKTLKRAMYGRSSFTLLRTRILTQGE